MPTNPADERHPPTRTLHAVISPTALTPHAVSNPTPHSREVTSPTMFHRAVTSPTSPHPPRSGAAVGAAFRRARFSDQADRSLAAGAKRC